MVPECHFYMDDSGSRDPDRKPTASNEPDWFALGGLLINGSDERAAKEQIAAFRARWPELGHEPFRSYDIRHRTERFRWLASCQARRKNQFYTELTDLITGLPMHVIACVVDRPGYNARYMQEYGPRRWRLCRTAFGIVVERAAKVARHRGARLRVFAERSDKHTEKQFKGYYDQMREDGLPFNPQNSQQYAPLSAEALRETLFEFRIKTKDSALMQFADLVLWPVCKAGYDKENLPYQSLLASGKLIDTHCTEENGLLGIKYSCFAV